MRLALCRAGVLARSGLALLLVACASPAAAPEQASALGAVSSQAPAAVATAASSEPTRHESAAPATSQRAPSTGPSRETLCEKALFELELAAAAPIDKCVGPKPSSSQPITIDVGVDEGGRIAETKWDVSTTTGYGAKAASCILAAVKAIPFAEPACANEWLLVRRAPARPPGGGFGLDSRL